MPYRGTPNEGWLVTATATNALATATKSAPAAGKAHYLTGVYAFYGAATGAGLLQVKDGSTVILEAFVKDTVPVIIHLAKPYKVTDATAVSAELAAGGASAVGKVNISGFTD
jgi:hypothetical protein